MAKRFGFGFDLGWVILLSSWARHFTLTVPLLTYDSKQVQVNYQKNFAKFWIGGGGGGWRGLVAYNGLISHVSGEVTPSHVLLWKPR